MDPEEVEAKESSLDMFENDIDSEIGGYSSEPDTDDADAGDAEGGEV